MFLLYSGLLKGNGKNRFHIFACLAVFSKGFENSPHETETASSSSAGVLLLVTLLHQRPRATAEREGDVC